MNHKGEIQLQHLMCYRHFYTYLKHLSSPSEAERTTEVSKIISFVMYFQTYIIAFHCLIILLM